MRPKVLLRTGKRRDAVRDVYPKLEDIGVKIPRHLIKDRFRSGFEHALRGGQISRVEHLRLSFREGFRAGKLYLQEVRRQRGILTFPMRGRIRLKLVG
jgi:hypothetical protein